VDIRLMVGELREELPPLDQFREIVAKTNTDDPDKADVAELRRLLREYPQLWKVAGDLAHHAVNNLVAQTSGGAVFFSESLMCGMEAIRTSLGYDHAPQSSGC
jgi:hypothetical protein